MTVVGAPTGEAGASGGEAPTGEHLLLYDGVCGLCNGVVRFVIDRDPGGVFQFAALQGPTGQAFFRRFDKSVTDLDTVYVVVAFRSPVPVILERSRAAFFILANLRGPWRWLVAAHVLPTWILDRLYNVVARNRYRWFGRYDTCLLPRPEVAKRFLD